MSQHAELVVALPVSSHTITAAQAADSIGWSEPQLLTALDELAAQLAQRRRVPADLPAPLPEPDAADPQWSRPTWTLWTLRMGWSVRGLRGVPVIGYLGLAHLLHRQEQSLRKASLKAGQDPATAMPAPRFRLCTGESTITVALFDRTAATRWALQTGRLDPDHVPATWRSD